MNGRTVARVPVPIDPPRSPALWTAFLGLWVVDTVAAGLFFVVPNGN